MHYISCFDTFEDIIELNHIHLSEKSSQSRFWFVSGVSSRIITMKVLSQSKTLLHWTTSNGPSLNYEVCNWSHYWVGPLAKSPAHTHTQEAQEARVGDWIFWTFCSVSFSARFTVSSFWIIPPCMTHCCCQSSLAHILSKRLHCCDSDLNHLWACNLWCIWCVHVSSECAYSASNAFKYYVSAVEGHVGDNYFRSDIKWNTDCVTFN